MWGGGDPVRTSEKRGDLRRSKGGTKREKRRRLQWFGHINRIYETENIRAVVEHFNEDGRAAKLSLLNFWSLFRDVQKPTRFVGGGWGRGGVVSEYFPFSPDADARFGEGGSSRIFP